MFKTILRFFRKTVVNRILILLKGKTITILGAKATGKTTFHVYLREQKLISEYSATTFQKLKGNVFKDDDYTFYISKGIDISGDESYVSYWEKLIKGSDYCFYLFNTEKVFNNNKNEVDYLEKNLKYLVDLANRHKSTVFIIGNFIDKVPNFTEEKIKYMRTLRKNIVNATEDADIQIKSIIWGHMNTKEGIDQVLEQVIAQMKLQNI